MPGLVADVVMMVIATFFVAMDYDRIVDFVARQLPEDKRRVMHHAWRNLKQTLGKYVKSYSLILLVTFVELSIGLSILGVENAVLIALLIAVFDILPVVGSAVITYPWAVIALIQGRIGFAIGMAVMATIIVVVRDVLEPQIVGQTVGMHPLLTLLSMVVGLRLFGGIGLLGLPVALVIIKNLNEQGIISLYRNPPKKEQPPRRPLWKGRRKAGRGTARRGESDMAVKARWLDALAADGEERVLLASLMDRYQRMDQRQYLTASHFLDLGQQALAQRAFSFTRGEGFVLWGGYEQPSAKWRCSTRPI